MRKLEIDLLDLEGAFESQDDSFGFRHLLDLNSGKVLMVTEEDSTTIEEMFETFPPEATFDEMVAQSDLGEIGEDGIECLRAAFALETMDKENYLEIEGVESRDSFRDMEDFLNTVEDKRLHRELAEALRGRKPFARFKAVLGASFHDRERWFEFQRERLKQHMTEWLNSEGIDPVFRIPEPVGPPPPEVRPTLLKAAKKFIATASAIKGVKRIAIVGELTTEHPKAADCSFLVTITDEMDLAPLAKAGRQLLGACNQVGRAGEVFLADTRGKYMGRTCPWKECEPGIRRACQALHCGRRQYLYDDLKVLKLETSIIQEPPIEVWPHVVNRVPVPADLAEALLSESGS